MASPRRLYINANERDIHKALHPRLRRLKAGRDESSTRMYQEIEMYADVINREMFPENIRKSKNPRWEDKAEVDQPMSLKIGTWNKMAQSFKSAQSFTLAQSLALGKSLALSQSRGVHMIRGFVYGTVHSCCRPGGAS